MAEYLETERNMKRTIKRILPILLCLVVICSIFWYLFVYDRGFTQDVFLSVARFFENHGNHSAATWLYNQAYIHSGNDDQVIIELAERFKKIGNYTKAEVVLSDAIAEGGSVDLYIALSRVYVEQDKLLDAANMLDNVINPDIKAQLDALRPGAPVATPAPGFYSQYINVTVESTAGSSLYISTDGDFPSTGDKYTDGFTLSGGENKLYAIAVGDNGLVSVPSYFGYTVGGVIEEVDISDPVLDALYRQMLGVGADTQLFTNDLWEITSLTLPEGIKDYTDLGRLTYLETLIIDGISIDSLQPLSTLTQLKSLTVKGCPISASDLSILGALPNLETLILKNCSLSNISGLSGAKRLVTLDLSNNAIRDLSGLSFMENLTTLDLSSNALTNLSALSALENLATLDVSYNSLTSLAPLAACPSLSVLVATNNKITEIPVFSDTSVLTTLMLNNNSLTDVTALAQYSSISKLGSYNMLSDVSALGNLKNLVSVDFSHNQITKLPTWSKNCALVDLNGAYNEISSVSSLRGLANLNNVNLDYNNLTNINALADCQKLVRVSVYGNSIKDVSQLTDMSVIVNYTPNI